MHMAYDARMSLGNYRGMGRYLRALIAGREHVLLGLCASGESDPDLRIVAGGMRTYPLWEQLSIPRLLRARNIDTFIAPYNTAPLRLPAKTRLILIVHDLIYMEPSPLSRSMYQNAGRVYRRLVTPHAIRRADLIVTVSRYTADRLAARFHVDERKIRVIPASIDAAWFDAPAAPREQAGMVLTVAGEAPSKNLLRALEAFALCRTRAHPASLRMKVAGVKPAFHSTFRAHAAALGVEDAVEFLPYLPDASLRALYRQADVLLMPSLAEGFGIPLLEAMASGVPVASSDAASLPEVGGDASLYFDPLAVEQMAAVLHRILSDAPLRNAMSDRGRAQARRFHPDAIQGRIQSFWNEVEQTVGPARPVECAAC